MKTKILLIVTGLIFIVAGFSGISSQQASSPDTDALRTEVAGTVIAEIYSTVQAEFSTIATQMAKTPEAQSGIIGEGFVKPTEVLYAHMAKLTKQDKNYLQYKMYEDWDVTFTFKNVGLQDWTNQEPLGNTPAVIVETANPAKFPVEVQKVVGWEPDVPANMLASLKLPEEHDRLSTDYAEFRDYLIGKLG